MAWKVQKVEVLGKSVPQYFIQVRNKYPSFSFLHIPANPCISVAAGHLSCFWLPMLSFSGVGNESPLPDRIHEEVDVCESWQRKAE